MTDDRNLEELDPTHDRDLVTRLREYRMDVDSPDVVAEAADEIELLRDRVAAWLWLAPSPWRDGWLEGRAMSLRRLQWWVAHEWDGTREHLDARLATQMAAVQYDRERSVTSK